MFVVIYVSIALVLVVVLFYRFIGVDRGLDTHKENVNAVVIGKEPYVTPAVDEQITEQMRSLQQMYIPVQYIDNGLMPKIEKSSKQVEKMLQSQKYEGPIAFVKEEFASNSFQPAKFSDALNNFQPNVPPSTEMTESAVKEIEPFNSFLGMIASEGQDVSLYDPESM